MAKETGLAHAWFDPHAAGFKNLTPGLKSCRRCGTVMPRDPERQKLKTCRGVVRVELR